MLDHLVLCHLMGFWRHLDQIYNFIIVLSLQQQLAFKVDVAKFTRLYKNRQAPIGNDRVELFSNITH